MTLREIPSLDPFEDDSEEEDEEEDEDMDDVASGERTPKEDRRGRIRWFLNHLRYRLYLKLRLSLIDAYRRHFVVPPDIWELSHYPQCWACRRLLELQGWEVEFKVSEEKKVYEVTFRTKNRKKSKSQFYV